MSGRCRERIVVAWAVAATAVLGASCGSTARARSDPGRDAGDAGGGADGSDAAQCPPPGDLTPEPQPQQVSFDGGVRIEQLAHALSVARCNYFSRCYALSTYLANECVDSLVSHESWAYETCLTANYVGFFCVWAEPSYTYPSADLLQAVAAGVIHYDAQQEGQCIAALLAEECASDGLFEEIPACVGVFSCASGTDEGEPGSTDGGAADGGPACSQLIPLSSKPLHTCSTNQDCVGVTEYPEGPDCVAGICFASPCGITGPFCTTFAGAGESCNSNALSPLNTLESTTPGGTCAPGLACHGQTADGGLDTCVVPVDVGGPCTDSTNCNPGLACACGTCEIPPTMGPCMEGLCEVGVAYCDPGNVCRPVRPSGASCADAINSCGPGLTCTGTGFCTPLN